MEGVKYLPHQVRWLGHASFAISTAAGKTVLIDPWLTGNPSCPVVAAELKGPDAILVTHDHGDHLGTDIPTLVKGEGTIVAVQPEVATVLKRSGVEDRNIVNMNIGGTVAIGDLKVTMTQAAHSAAAGSPCGFVLTLEDGKTIYHAGDTGLFESMTLVGEIYHLDLALLPIGSVFTMDPLQAAVALTLLRPAKVIPMHYGTFPTLVPAADGFVRLAREKAPGVEVVVLRPGGSLSL
ncbi:MAG: metal-dependent hydrolase [bacterium]|nr:metal-dependent hydrolase [bacterium]